MIKRVCRWSFCKSALPKSCTSVWRTFVLIGSICYLKMDIWILIAAAGSGYLSHFWQSFQSSKDGFGDITDDDDDQSGPPSHTSPTRKYSCFSLPRRKCVKGGFHQNWPKLNQSGGAVPGGCSTKLYLPSIDNSESWEVQASHNALQEDACSSPNKPKRHKGCYVPAQSHTTSVTNTPPRCADMRNFNHIWPQNCCGLALMSRLSMKASSKLAGPHPDNWHYCMNNLYSKDHPDHPCKMDKHSECFSGRRVKGRHDIVMVKEEQAFSLSTTLTTSDWDQFEEVCALALSDANNMQECEVRNSWNVMLDRKDERRYHLIKGKRGLACCRPMTSSKSYACAPLGNEHSQEKGSCCHTPIIPAEEQSLYPDGELFGMEAVQTIASDCCPSNEDCRFSSSRETSSTVLERVTLPSMAEKEKVDTFLERSSPAHCLGSESIIGGSKGPKKNGHGSCEDKVEFKGFNNHHMQMLLFNFGVGVGVMLAIMSSKHGKWQSMGQLEEVLFALRALEEEVQNMKELRLGFDSDRDKRDDVFAEQNHFVLKLVQKVLNAVEKVRISLLKNSASASAIDFECPEERARQEAELEAELEKMEMNFYLEVDPNCGDATELCGKNSCANEDELKIGNAVQGELSTRNIPCDADAQLSILDGYNSSREVMHLGLAWAVPPVELAKRLYEVLEARQKERIIELEAESRHLDRRLQAKEREFKVWKQRVRELLQETACVSLSSLQEDVHVEAQDASRKVVASSSGKVTGPDCQVSLIRNNEDILNSSVDKAYSISPNILQSKTCCDDEASEKACERHLQPSNKSVDVCPSYSQCGVFRIGDRRDHWSWGGTMVQPEVMHASYSSLSSGSPNDAKIDDLGYCSATLVDTETVSEDHLNNQVTSDIKVETRGRHNFLGQEWNAEDMHCPDTCGQDVIEIDERHGQLGQTLDSIMSEGSSNPSDLDEQMGQLLIQRIVQKGRKGSLIVEVAKSVMDSFDLES